MTDRRLPVTGHVPGKGRRPAARLHVAAVITEARERRNDRQAAMPPM
ncbi:MAG: hypothetical protein LBT40_05665 [Deltaproteobacteria bacterium]|nr:hypothetical protein [Deltaproteobacteria bacterium]